jgi:hypothetical protein
MAVMADFVLTFCLVPDFFPIEYLPLEGFPFSTAESTAALISCKPTSHCQSPVEAPHVRPFKIHVLQTSNAILRPNLTSYFLGARDCVFTFSIWAPSFILCTLFDFNRTSIKTLMQYMRYVIVTDSVACGLSYSFCVSPFNSPIIITATLSDTYKHGMWQEA